jgi:acyl-CoA synthetase (AMP-forming)/AMP-acid ligase II
VLDRITAAGGLLTTMVRAGLIAPLRPDRYLRIIAAAQRENRSITSGFAMSAKRCPDRAALVDELGTLTFRQIDERSDALAVALQELASGSAGHTIGIMCRNHRGFVESLVAATRIGADILLLNTSFAGPALAEVVTREAVDIVIYDQEFDDTVDRALADAPDTARILGWTDEPGVADRTVEKLISARLGQHPAPPQASGKLILLTSGTTGKPKGAKHSGGGLNELKTILDRIPWRTEQPVVVVAPMFHAWGFSQLAFAASMACTVITRRRFDPEATLRLIDEHQAYGLCVVPVMFDRIMDLPDEVRRRYQGRSLRFATASGSRMRPDVVIRFMDDFGDVIYNNYNATEAGMIATATPTGQVGSIYVRNGSQFDGYTDASEGAPKSFHDGFMSSGDIGRFDAAGRLFVVGRDDEMIVSGGENVYPIEVEKALTAHDGVVEAAVIGVDDQDYGQRLVAFVVLDGCSAKSPADATAEQLKQHVRDSLANYKVPRHITVLGELPRNNTGKVLRRELQVLAETLDGS